MNSTADLREFGASVGSVKEAENVIYGNVERGPFSRLQVYWPHILWQPRKGFGEMGLNETIISLELTF